MALHEAYDYAIEQVELALAQHRSGTRRSIVYVMSATGNFETCRLTPEMSALRGIVLKKSFLADEPNFLGPLMRSTRGDVRDHIDIHKRNHEPWYWP